MDPVRDQLQKALGETYRVDRELGGGGMSRVFLSTETALDRKVVLKILPPELASGVSVERFKREISMAARLQHAHIVPLLSAGDANGLPWFSMPFVEGESLRARLGRGELPIAEAVRTMRDVASALAYAHGKGVVHRDIKPENILLADGSATVTDFGVAKALVESATGNGGTLTSVGMALGTPAYMSPEQAAGDERTDNRADIYALGVVTYEMLAGRNPFAGRSPQATLAAHMTETPAPVEQVRQATPPALAQLVNRCLAKSAADRPQSAQEIVHALDALVTPTGTNPLAAASGVAYPAARRPFPKALIAAALVVVALGSWFGWRAMRGPDLDRRTIAVLPFDVLTSDTAVAQAARVAADWLMQGIAQTDSANVVSSTAISFAIGDSKAASSDAIAKVAAATRAGTMVTGSVARFGDSLRIQATIVDARSRRVIRAIDPVSGPVSDPLVAINALRDKVLGSIVSGDVVRRVALAGQPPNYSAYREYLAGAELFPRNQSASRPFFRRAIGLDSTFAQPYNFLAAAMMNAGEIDSAEVVVARLDALRDKLSALDRLILDYGHAMIGADWEAQLAAAQKYVARTSDPSYLYGVGRAANGLLRPGVAIPALEASDSVGWAGHWQPSMTMLATAYHQAGDYRKQLTYLDLARTRYPNSVGFVSVRLGAFAGLGDSRAALALADTLLRAMTDPTALTGPGALNTGAWEFAAHGDTATANRLTQLVLRWTRDHAPSIQSKAWHRLVGRTWLDAGNADSAGAHLKLAFPDTTVGTVSYLAIVAARTKDVTRARAIADSLGTLQRKWDFGLTPYWRAGILAELGDREQAMRLLQEARQKGQSMSAWHTQPALASLHGYPPFEAMIKPQK